ncbi:MAG: 4-hydroxy-3-methylbut-2-enyl diphosphate reductase [Oscillospiraceae bacterium]|nr:4-hydroxy-3-methylbut-2-enyl diphosphate reductase [Oscillospiraceae bacterium]
MKTLSPDSKTFPETSRKNPEFKTFPEIVIAENAGFCSGVKRAIDIAVSAAAKHGKAYTIGRLVHNNDAIRLLEGKNVFALEDNDNFEDYALSVPKDAALVIRSHGIGKEAYNKLSERISNGTCYDATCPYVKKIHAIAESCSESDSENPTIIIAGDKSHPEVKGIIAHISEKNKCEKNHFTVNSPDELKALLSINKDFRQNALIFIAQTTFLEYNWRECIKILKKGCTNAKIFDTICKATVKRQNQAREISRKISESEGIMIVIGSKQSSNSVKLYEICRDNCENTFFIENANSLDVKDMIGQTRVIGKIGITAGASVPAEIIKEVHDIMNAEIKTMGEFGTELNNEADEAALEAEIDFMAEVDKTFQKIYTGKRVKAYVMSINNNEVVVDLGVKQSGYIPSDEIGDAELKMGDEIECIVTKVNDAEGFVHLSKKRVDSELGYEKLLAAFEMGAILQGNVESVVNGGLIVAFEGQRVFVPASQSGIPRSGKLEVLLRQKVKFKVIEVDEQRKRLVGSIRAASRVESDALKEKFWKEIEVGKTYVGEVKSIESFGVFVDLGGVDGMVHLSELTWTRVKHPSDAVKVGDKLEVAVKSYDPDKRRVSLTAKKTEDNPWTKFISEYSVGQTISVTVVNITPFGAFAQIVEGIDGLIHISQISRERINNVSDALSPGQVVDVQITEINADYERVGLSIKALLEPEEEPEESLEEKITENLEEGSPENVSEEASQSEEVVADVSEENVS